MATLGFLVLLATVFAVFTEDGATCFFATTVTKSPPKGVSLVTTYSSGSEFIAGAVTLATLGLPFTAHALFLFRMC
jgi:hypothetical protein